MCTPPRTSTSPASWTRSQTSYRRPILPSDLADRLLAGDLESVPAALNLADDTRPAQVEACIALLTRLESEAAVPGATRIGITGAPGAGKSSLLDALVRNLRPRDLKVAIIAVDPSSQQTGGALLGDRIRIRAAGTDPGVFVRSMAARSRLGGLADATWAGAEILATAFDRVFIETVGVGQSEADVADLADTLVYVVSPGSGDILQFMKAGLLELPDIFVVNKSDLGAAAARTASELSSGVRMGDRPDDDAGWTPPVVSTSARDGVGIEELVEALETHRSFLIEQDLLIERRRRGRNAHVIETLERRYGSHGLARIGGRRSVIARIQQHRGPSSFVLIAELGREIEDALRKPA